MYPEIFGIIKSYGLMLAISFGVGLYLTIVRGRKYNLSSDTSTDLIFTVLVSSIIGVRLFFVLTHLGDFHPWYRAFFIWDGGLTLYGGIFAAIFAVWYLGRRRGIPFLVSADLISPALALGIGITRIGCFLAGCCYGMPSDCSCAVTFPAGAPASLQFGMVAVYPSQLYGSLGGFAVFGLLLIMERFSYFRGATFGRYLIFYGIARFLIDFSRYYEPEQVMLFGWSNNQWISLGLMIVGTVILVLGARGRLGGPWRAKEGK